MQFLNAVLVCCSRSYFSDSRRGAGGVVFRGRDSRCDTLAPPSPVALQLGFMWGARVPGWYDGGMPSEPKMEVEGHKTEICNVEKTFCDKVFQECDLMATNCVQELMMQTV